MDLNQILAILASLIGMLGGYHIHRIKNKTIKLRRRITFQTVANSFEDELWGTVKILHNEKEIEHLHLTTIEIFNNSGRDIDDLIINIRCISELRIISSRGINADTRILLNETGNFKKRVDSKDWEYLHTNREYKAKVLNRGTHFIIDLLIDSDKTDIFEEDLIVAIEKKGVKVLPYKNISDSTQGQWSLIIGIILVLISGFVTYILYPDSKVAIIIMTIVGALNIFFGLLIYYSLVGWGHYQDDIEDEDD